MRDKLASSIKASDQLNNSFVLFLNQIGTAKCLAV